jgi:hypothetical protein
MANALKFDVTSALLSSNNPAVIYFTERDLFNKNMLLDKSSGRIARLFKWFFC